MSSPPDRNEHPDLKSLVLQSRKALQHGEALCSRANATSTSSAKEASDVLALNAKIQWISHALAAVVAKLIEQRRAKLEKQTQARDTSRSRNTDMLDAILESLGTHVVPPGFHENASGSSIFVDPSSDSEVELPHKLTAPDHSPTLTIRNSNGNVTGVSKKARRLKEDKSRWRTLRDFVDERAIEDALETIESERNQLEDSLAVTASYTVTLQNTLHAIRETLPSDEPAVDIHKLLSTQEHWTTGMAHQLESLAEHFEKMEVALKDSEAGERFSEGDIQEMLRDAEELPVILAELEDAWAAVERSHEELLSAKQVSQQRLHKHRNTLEDLEELGDIMDDMLRRQDEIEADCSNRLDRLYQNLVVIEDLIQQFNAYRLSYSKLLVEIARRRQYKEAAENIVRGMVAQLEAMSEEERVVRESFNAEHGAHLPSDLCLYIENPPTRWQVTPLDGDALESVPDIDNDLLVEVDLQLAPVSKLRNL
ncbi:autophagy protein Apg17-domain-containing protein [Multifurca ochricompacta]|uniref:Autophagy-related protein 17 n=1 Tax=Multifurca ochricompacta TaxID=376703 RepID=A0AAD4QQ19_9AGAM|nr:autophagy protein Apg17-domain-containing protein [Multifurca ochricompacta]